MDPPAAAWAPPQQFDEYRLIKLLGQGSMGRVYLAQDTVLERAVAIKFITEADPEDRERFFVEARAAARLQHPNVVTVHRVGALDGHPFLITEFIRGKSLSELPLPLPWRKVLELGIGLARGLAAAHRHGVLHRDIKLANALLTETGEVKLLDFSLAKLFDPNTNDTTHRQPDLGAALDAATSAVERHEAEQSPRAKPLTADEGAPHAISSSQRMQAAAISASWLSETLSAPPGAPPPTPPPTPPSAGAAPPSSLTQVGTLLGTPNYMAPELWRAEPATRRSDVYALGVLLYILTSGWPPTEAATTVELATRIQREEPRPLLERAPRCDARLAAIVDRCLRRDPFERFAAGEDLLAALEALAPSTRELTIPEGNPYRGLQAFESQHRALFFGRSAEIRAVLERLRASPLVVVAGDSGVGKSSLCKAGVAPLVDEGQLGSSRQWSSVGITPGRYPFPTFVNALAELFDMSEEALGALARGPTDDLVRSLRKRLGEGRGRLLVIDQLEELATLADPTEAGLVGPLLARLASGIPGLRILATVRGDFLTRVAQIPELGDELARAIYILRPLSPEGAREAIVGPARVKGVGFESEELVQDLIRAGSRGSLPLMQFALAELWEIRDPLSPVITAAELRKIGGVSGALARHGDAVLAELIPEQRHAARRVLMRLVTVDDTRAVRSEDELTDGSPAAAAALKALVRSRLVVAREVAGKAVFEIAHEALLGGWATLSHWLDEARESRLLHHRLELAVTDWERLGRSRDVLWSGAQLQELLALDPAALRPREQDFLAASRAAAARARLLRRAAALAIPIVAVLTYGGVWLKGKLDLRGRVDALAAAAADDRAAAEAMLTDTERQRTEAFAAYDAGKTAEGESLWRAYVAKIPGAERQLARAAQQLETGLSLDPQRDDLREPLLDVLLRRALLAEELGRDAVTIDDHLERLRLHDRAGEHLARWDAPATLRVRSDPPGARAFLERYVDEDGRRRIRDVEALGVTPLDPLTRPRGSYRLRLELQDHAPVLYPVLLGRGETLDLELPLPRAEQVPAGFVFVPAGAFLYGSNDVEAMRRFMRAEPMHQVETGPYLIARHEVTFGDYIAFLEAQTPERRAEILKGWTDVVKLAERPGGGWRMTLNQGLRDYTAETGAELVYEGRTERARVMWEQLPVAGISPDEVHEFMRWLDQTGRVPGARLCDEREWERAARGADGRLFPTGDVLRPTDANFDETYGKVTSAFGPDPVGSYPHAESPFGLLDADGNIFELTASARQSGAYMVRGGGYYYAAIQARTSIRFDVASVYRNSSIGVRVCATWSASLR